PNLPDALSTKGMVLASQEKDAAALTTFNRALAIAPNFPDALVGMYMLYLAREEFSEALAVVNQLVQTAPNDARGWRGKGMVHNLLHQHQGALYALDRALE